MIILVSDFDDSEIVADDEKSADQNVDPKRFKSADIAQQDPVVIESESAGMADHLVSEASEPVNLCPGPVNPIDFLPEMVETKTGEEEEEVLFEQRAKCYRYF